MIKKVQIRALKAFDKTTVGPFSGAPDLCDVGEEFPVSETRAGELERLGLAERADDAVRDSSGVTAPLAQPITQPVAKPLNKIAPKPSVKKEK